MAAQNDLHIVVLEDKSGQDNVSMSIEKDIDYSQRGQWLRAAVLGATDGLVSVASLMMGVGAVKHDVREMILTGFAGLVAGACSMAIGEFVSVYSQRDVEVAQMKRDARNNKESGKEEALPNPIQAAAASALAFMLGAIMPLLAAAFILDHKIRLGVVVATVTLALVVFGWIGAILGRTPVMKSCFRILIGGGGRWLRAAVLGATDGYVSVASLMTGVKAVTQDVKAVIITGFAGLVAGASGTVIGEFVSERDVEVARMKRDGGNNKLPLNPIQDKLENKHVQVSIDEDFDYSQRGQWLRAAVLGATDGLVSVASLMMGVGAVKQDVKAMILIGFAGLFAGACSMAIGEFVSVYSQRDVEVAQMKRDARNNKESENEALPNPIQAAAASALAFMLGAIVPLLAAAFIVDHKVRLGVVVATVSLALVVFGWIGAILGKTPVMKSCLRILIGGWMAMAITFGLTKWIEEDIDYSQRGQWLRAAVLGATDGLVSVSSLMMGVGAVKHDVRAMILTGFAGLVAGACSMAIGEFVSVHSQRDVEMAQMKREGGNDKEGEDEALPNPIQAAAASALAFMLGAFMPLLAAAFIVDHKVRLGVVVATVSLALVVFGWIGAVLGKTPVMKSCLRILVGGWMAMAITFGLTMWIGSTRL
ncbi:hypothetical protein OSB04_030870 [Centaurea solstitialis]|uniref:Uncharacterized protein n=1 Tax=Centaurea solstitialis TaxID=347529 RepID=A0AA38SRY8_9ASTR|nr:hypothetical protein OSB04_030870 [Centaurea solstitialis]